tara:strand:- start:270 stop:560 length:291 start_codon:yes stop_codon:yes gene_type:complete
LKWSGAATGLPAEIAPTPCLATIFDAFSANCGMRAKLSPDSFRHSHSVKSADVPGLSRVVTTPGSFLAHRPDIDDLRPHLGVSLTKDKGPAARLRQ